MDRLHKDLEQKNIKEYYSLGFRYYRHFCRTHHLDELAPYAVNFITFLLFNFEVNPGHLSCSRHAILLGPAGV